MKGLPKNSVAVLWSLAVLGAAMFTVGDADACCVHNRTGEKIKFAWSLATDWHVAAGQDQCEYGKGGKMNVWIERSLAADTELCGDLPVDDHGDVWVYQSENTFTTKSLTQGGEVKMECVKTVAGTADPKNYPYRGPIKDKP